MTGGNRITQIIMTMGTFAIAFFIVACEDSGTPTGVFGPSATATPTATLAPTAAAKPPVTLAPTAAAPSTPGQASKADLYIEDVTASPGGSVVVQVIVRQDIKLVTPQGEGVGSADLKVVYDDTVLTAISANTRLAGAFTNVGIPGEVLASSASISGTEFLAGEPILEIAFDVSPGAPSGGTIVKLEKASLTDTAAPPRTIQTNTMDGTITIN